MELTTKKSAEAILDKKVSNYQMNYFIRDLKKICEIDKETEKYLEQYYTCSKDYLNNLLILNLIPRKKKSD